MIEYTQSVSYGPRDEGKRNMKDPDGFPEEVVEALRCYVYRLIDPRNGETFYVGRGQEQRVFAHVSGKFDDAEQSVADPKLERIREIRALGMNIEHVIHRHGMSEAAAKEVEAALIDAYPGLVNRVAGEGSRDRGTRHGREILLEYSAEEFVVEEPLILISIGQLWNKLGVYDAVKGVWRLDIKRAKKHKLVLAHVRGVVRGAYRPKKWFRGAWEKFPERVSFEGTEAEPKVWERYVGKRVPSKYRKRGAQNAIRYLSPP